MQAVTIQNAPQFLNINDQAMWVLGYNEAVQKMQCTGCAVQQGTHVPAEAVVQIQEPAALPIDEKQIKALMRKHRIWIEVSRLFESNLPERELRAVQAEEHQFKAFVQDLISASQLAAVQQAAVEPFMYAIADGYGQPFFEEQGCVSSDAKDLQPEVDSLNQNLDGEPPYKVVAVYTHPTQQGLDAQNEWEGIESLPVCDDLIWLYCQDTKTVDGPIAPCPSFVDSWTHWAYANAPSTAVIDAAIAAKEKTAEALEMARNGGCGCCANACADRSEGCRFVHESPSAADMDAAQAKQGAE